jgi:hypothetical protein
MGLSADQLAQNIQGRLGSTRDVTEAALDVLRNGVSPWPGSLASCPDGEDRQR